MIQGIDHIGIAVRSLEDALPFWTEALGLKVAGVENVDTEEVKVAFLNTGSSRIELLEPTHESSTIARHLEKRGRGIHHLTLRVEDLDSVLIRARERGAEVLGSGARPGAGGSRVAFLHPKSTGGVLLELVERPRARPMSAKKIGPGSPVLVYLQDPQQKMWGLLQKLDAAGVFLHGIDLDSFDDWMSQVEAGEPTVVGPSVIFVPMSRVERVLLDQSSGELPSMAERFEERVGRTIHEVIADFDEQGS